MTVVKKILWPRIFLQNEFCNGLDLPDYAYFCRPKNITMRIEIGNASEIKAYIKNEMALIIYFYNDDCPPCLSLRPKVEAMVKDDYPEMKLIFVNSKNYPEIPASFSIFSNPTLLVYFDGKESKRFSKYISISELSQSIDRYYKMIFS